MLAEAPNIDGPNRGDRSLPGEHSKEYFPDEGSAGLPVARMGLEQEFFLVDRTGAPSDLADPFLWGCRQAAREQGLDPRCFESESVKGLVEITTPPSQGAEEMARHYLDNRLYANLREVGGLSAYASRVEDLIDQQSARYRAWFAAMDRAGVERRLFAQAGGNLHRASWNPVRLSHHGTIEIRSMDANLPEMTLAVCALIRGAAERVRRERLEVRPSRGVLTLEPDGDLLHVPIFSYLNGELLGAAVTRGMLDRRVEAYIDSVVRFAFPYLENPELIDPLGSSGSYKTTECEILESFPDRGLSVSRDQGLSLVREACRRLNEQISALRRRYDDPLPGDGHEPQVARVISIRDSPTVFAEGAHPESVGDEQAMARAADKELA